MKRLIVFALICGFCGSLFAQGKDKPADSRPASPALMAIQTANSLAKYGYSAYSASALIGAAEILASIQTQALGAAPETEGSLAAGSKSEKPEFVPAALLADAKKYAGKDATMLAWADKVEKSLGTKTRGAAGGPRYQYDKAPARGNVTYQLPFTAGRLAEVAVSGDGDTILDLYIYDQSGNLIVYDDGYSDDCYVNWVPKWTGNFVIRVVNRGTVYNRFEIATN